MFLILQKLQGWTCLIVAGEVAALLATVSNIATILDIYITVYIKNLEFTIYI